MAENGLNACFGGISQATQTFAVRSAVLSNNYISQTRIGLFDIYREL